LQVFLRQLRRRSTRILGHNLLQDAFDSIGMAEATFDVGQLVQRIRHLVVLGIKLADLGKGLTRALQITFGKVDLAQPVLGIARVLAVRVFAQECGKCLAGLVEILGFDQVEGCIVIQLLLGRIARL